VRTRAAIVLVLTAAFAFLLPSVRAGAGGACMGGLPGEGFTDTDGSKVAMVEACFSPTVIRVAPGDTVTFTNKDKMVHAVGGAVGSFGDPHKEILSGDSISYRFDDEGTFPYVCIFHPGMAGAVVVGDGEGPAFEAGGIAQVSTDEGGGDGALEERTTVPTSSDSGFLGWEAMLVAAALVLLGSGLLWGWRRRSDRALQQM
jgi:plastocyanin